MLKKITFKEYLQSLGPGAIMAASIIGPGTVTTASTQGASYGYTCLWLILVSCVIAYFFQEPGSRIAIGLNKDMMIGVREHMGKKVAVLLYVVVLVGSLAFQAGNISGATMALTYFFPGTSAVLWAVAISVIGCLIYLTNKFSLLENINQLLIILMVLAFIITAFASGPSIGDMITEGFSFHIPGNNATLALSLLATTVCPNLVLGFSAFTLAKYGKTDDPARCIKMSNFGLGFNMTVAFFITSAIVVCAGTVLHPQGITVTSAGEMAGQLVPLLGRFAGVFFALGLFAAAFSSVLYHITLQERLLPKALGLDPDPKAIHNRVITAVVLLVPIIVIAVSGSSPVSLIITAQALNGFALPLVFIISWKLTSDRKFMGEFTNSIAQNVIFGVVTALTLIFALNALRNVANTILGML